MTTAETLFKLRNMVDEFIREHSYHWDKVREVYRLKTKEEWLKLYPNSDFEGHQLGRSLSLQSHIGSDMLIDFVYLAAAIEKGEMFTREYWIRSHGTQCIKSVEDVQANRSVWNDVVAKIIVVFDGKEVTMVEWFQDEDCKVKNTFIKDDTEARMASFSAIVNSK